MVSLGKVFRIEVIIFLFLCDIVKNNLEKLFLFFVFRICMRFFFESNFLYFVFDNELKIVLMIFVLL